MDFPPLTQAMFRLYIQDPARPAGRETHWRHRFSLAGVALCVILMGWGGFVTSIDAGLAVPDWPTSFGSYDPVTTGFSDPTDPDARWWQYTPVLAEHGHRLLGALLGLWVLILALWTWRTEARSWMRRLSGAALGLVVLQGVLGGLRVVWVSLDLAVVHAFGAQLLFGLLLALTLFTSASWVAAIDIPQEHADTRRLRLLSAATVIVLIGQILLGALLRHPGGGVHLGFAVVHIVGAIVVLGLIVVTCGGIRRDFAANRLLNRAAWVMMGAVFVQLTLGFLAFAVLLIEHSMAMRSTMQVVLNSAHLVMGAVLFGAAVCTLLLLMRRQEEGVASTG